MERYVLLVFTLLCIYVTFSYAEETTEREISFQHLESQANVCKFGALRNCAVGIPELAQFAAYCGVSTYGDLKAALHEFATSRVTFGQFMKNPMLFTSSHVQSAAAITPEQEGSLAMESKVDELAAQLKELTLMVKNIRTPDKPPASENKTEDRTCSYCRKPGHTANHCEANPHRTTRCNNCGKLGHPARNCWSARKDTTQQKHLRTLPKLTPRRLKQIRSHPKCP